MSHRALVLDGVQKSALAATRSLGKVGVVVTTAAESPSALCSWSRYSSEFIQYPSPKKNLDGFVDWLLKYAETCGKAPVVYAFSDATHLAIARNRQKLEGKILFTWNQSVFLEQAFSKKQTYELATRLGVPIITEHNPESVTEFPVVLKPYTSVSWSTGQGKSSTAEFAFSEVEYQELRRKIISETGQEPIVQTFVQGGEYGVEFLVKNGTIVRQFAHKRIRSLSPRGGAAVVKKTAPTNEIKEKMQSYATKLVEVLEWNGPIMVEFKVDTKNGQPILMEINGRFWGSLPLAEVAGAAFVSGHYDLLTGSDVTSQSTVVNIRTQHFLGDLKWVLAVLFKSDKLRQYLYPSRISAIGCFIYDTFFTKGDVFAWTDPLPMAGEVVSIRRKNQWQR